MSLKQEALNIISSLPEDVKIEDIMYRLYVLKKIRAGQEAIKNGNKLSIEEMRMEMQSW